MIGVEKKNLIYLLMKIATTNFVKGVTGGKKMPDWNYKVLDHRWNNFKRWFEAMEKVKDQKPWTTIDAMRAMIDTCDKMAESEENLIIETVMGEVNAKRNHRS